MRLTIRSVADKGNTEKERLVLKVDSNTDIGDYILIQAGFYDNSVTTEIHHTYWFPNKEVETGDLVVVYTKSGRENQKEMKNGHNAHFFYWGITTSIWSRDDRAPVLFHAPDWISKDPNDL